MAKTKISQFDAVASNNTDINSVNVAEGCPPSGINNAIREMASLLKKQEVGTDAMTSPDIDGGTIDGATIGGSSGVTIGVSDGTVSAPSIKFTGDTNTGIYRGGTDILKFVTAGTDAITINASQQVSLVNNLSITANLPTFTITGQGRANGFEMAGTAGDTTLTEKSNNGITLGTNNTSRLKIANNGNISFYEDTGTTAKLFWDASVQALSVNESTIISGGTAATTPSIQASEGGTAGAGFGVVSANDEIAGQLRIAASSQNAVYLEADPSDQRADSWLGFRVDGDNVGRFDTSGNLLVGTTTDYSLSSTTATGIKLAGNGTGAFYRDGGVPLYVNRGEDGTLINLRVDGSLGGVIGVLSTRPYIGKTDTALFFNDTSDAITPYDIDAVSQSNGVISLGTSGNRFNNLYLSGGVYLGGTGSANKLDDYEEGTWTATDVSGAGLTLGVGTTAMYTKIGRLVTVNAHINFPSTSNTQPLQIGGLPFANGGSYSYGSVRIQNLGVSNLVIQVQINNSFVYVYRESDIQVLNNDCSSQYILFSATYFTS